MATKKKVEENTEEIVREENLEDKDPREMTPEESKKYWSEKVPFRAFKDSGKYKEDIVVGLNGKIWVIQRGKDVMIPRNVREIILQSMAQDEATADMIDNYETSFLNESKKYE